MGRAPVRQQTLRPGGNVRERIVDCVPCSVGQLLGRFELLGFQRLLKIPLQIAQPAKLCGEVGKKIRRCVVAPIVAHRRHLGGDGVSDQLVG